MAGLDAAFDRVRFADAARLDLHPLRPTAPQAAGRVRAWVLERQVQGFSEVLVITGRGRHSEGGVSAVRASVHRALARLTREGVVSAVTERTPGSVVVALAPLGARLDALARRRDPAPPARPPVRRLEGLPDDLVEALEGLAAARLEHLGVTAPTAGQVVDEMRHVFSRLVGTQAPSEDALRAAIERARDELDA
ncbi:MAG: Smr/MutS family protein [Gemmatimonadaceae bacterium]|nr:Smr/MutS family protein [Gemmatimonadaceae bacterium]